MDKLKRLFTNRFCVLSPEKQIEKEWESADRPIPPPHSIKQQIISSLQKQLHYDLFIESGTYLGAMVEAQKANFKKVWSVELSDELFAVASAKFSKDSNVEIWHGDSGDVFVDLVRKLHKPALFWLDGHYSAGITAMGKKECPIYEELTAIFNGKALNHVLLIDDARLFIGENDYPTLDELYSFIREVRPEAKIYCAYDIIHVFI